MTEGLRVISRNDEDGKTVVTVETQTPPPACPACGSAHLVGFGKRGQSVADLPESGRPVVLRIVTKRFRCKDCSRSFYETPAGVTGNRRMTDRLAAWIRQEAQYRRFTNIATATGLSEGTVRALLRASGEYPRRKR